MLPEILSPEDPTAGDEALFSPGDFGNYARFGRGHLREAELREAELAFHAAYLDILAGRAAFSSIAPHAARCGVDWPIKLDRRPPFLAEGPLPDEVLADVVENFVADWPVWIERVTGDALARPTLAIVSVLAFVAYAEKGRRPVDAWHDEEEDRELAGRIAAVDRVPPMVWHDGRPLLPLAPLLTPPDLPPGVYVARAYPTRAGWALSGRVDLPGIPAEQPLQRRMELELMRIRLVERRSTWEDVLRRRPEVLYRAAMEGVGIG